MKTYFNELLSWFNDTAKLMLAVSFMTFIMLLPIVTFAASVKFLLVG